MVYESLQLFDINVMNEQNLASKINYPYIPLVVPLWAHISPLAVNDKTVTKYVVGQFSRKLQWFT